MAADADSRSKRDIAGFSLVTIPASGTTPSRQDPTRASNPLYFPTLPNYVAPQGRFDASLSYDVSDQLRLDVGATNILRARYDGYYELRYLSNQYRYDETTYSVGVRVRI